MILLTVSRIAVVIAVFIGLSALVYFSLKSGEEVHFHAGFQVYKDNKLQDYSGFEFMHLAPCGKDGHEMSPDEEQQEKAHLHDNIGDVVHVHREGATWGDLFNNIKVEINPEIVYVNGDEFSGDILTYPIKEYDSVVIFEGENTEIAAKVENRVRKERIEQAESASEGCAL